MAAKLWNMIATVIINTLTPNIATKQINLPVNGTPDEWSREKITKKGKGRYILRQEKHHIKNASLSRANPNRCIYLPHMAAYLIFDCLCQFVKVTGLAGGFSHSIITAIIVMYVLRRVKNGFCDCALLIKGIWHLHLKVIIECTHVSVVLFIG